MAKDGVHTYPDIFENADIFSPLLEYAPHTVHFWKRSLSYSCRRVKAKVLGCDEVRGGIDSIWCEEERTQNEMAVALIFLYQRERKRSLGWC